MSRFVRIIFLLFLGALSVSCVNQPGTCGAAVVKQSDGCSFGTNPSQIVIGSMLAPAQGASQAQLSYQASAELAVKELNAQLAQANPKVSITLVEGDLGANPDQALSNLKVLYNQGVRVFVGPSESANVIALLAFANINGMIMMSNASSAITLAIPNDNLYRLVPGDSHQTERLAAKIYQDGFRNIIIFARQDLYGDDFRKSLKTNFLGLDPANQELEEFLYDAKATDFSVQAAEWDDAITALPPYDPTKTALVFISFEEVVPMVQAMIAQDAALFGGFKIYGTDGFAQTVDVTNDATVAGFLLASNLVATSPAVALVDQPNLDAFYTRLATVFSGPPSVYAAVAYDCVTLLTKTAQDLNSNGQSSISAWKTDLPIVAAATNGITGNLALSPNGDRASLPYGLWGLQQSGATFSWQLLGLIP